MNLIDVIILMLINVASFVIGAKVGQTVSKGKDITLNPVKAVHETIKDNKERKIAALEERKYNTILENIDNYDGTGRNQKKIPIQ